MMLAIQIACLAIVLLYVVVKSANAVNPWEFLARFAALTVAAWVGENTVIRAYGFYSYDPGWSVFVDQVPLLIVLIWPVVIHSAWDIARALGRGRANPLATSTIAAVFVLADASLIEPIAVSAGLWQWSEPGFFQVPPIGVLGWSFFAWAAVWCFENRQSWTTLLVAPVFAHLALLASWWLCFRWLNHSFSPTPLVVAAWCASAGLTTVFAWKRFRGRVPTKELLLRVPGALFFFALLLIVPEPLELLPYALAFVPPYLALMVR